MQSGSRGIGFLGEKMSEEKRMYKWIRRYRNDYRVHEWLEKHPPPPEWESGDLEYAYLMMPNPDSWVGRLLLRLGV